jgi:extradiol dioxygenase family protein
MLHELPALKSGWMTQKKVPWQRRSVTVKTMSQAPYPRFHLAVPVTDLVLARAFYAGQLGCATGRESSRWIDFDFFGHQLVTHLVEASDEPEMETNQVSGHDVPASHFGIVMAWPDYETLLEQLTTAGTDFVIDHHIRFAGKAGEQATFFLKDPSGNHLEFKAFRDMNMLFATDLEQY